MNDNIIKISLVSALILVLFFTAFVSDSKKLGSTPSGLPSTVASSSAINVGSSTLVNLFTANNACASRVITTKGDNISLWFSDTGSTTPDGTIGFIQYASTTVAYDSGLYGCGYWNAKGHGATTTITKMETW